MHHNLCNIFSIMHKFSRPMAPEGGSHISGVYVPQQNRGLMESSQESARSQGTSQPVSLASSFEGSPLDGGRSHVRFQEFVSRTRHAELLESIREIHAKVTGLELKLVQIENQNNAIIEQQCNNRQQFNEVLQQSANGHSYFHSLDHKVQLISNELQQNLAKLSQINSIIEENSHVSKQHYVSEIYREVSLSKTASMDNLWEEDSDCADGIPLSDYLFTRSKKVEMKVESRLLKEESYVCDSHMSPAIKWEHF